MQNRFFLWKVIDVVDIANGINGEANKTQKFSEVFESKLTFVQLYSYLKSHKRYVFNIHSTQLLSL